MSVYTKLMQARLKLQNTDLKKSGHNKFAGYKYFELGDFLPTVQNIFAELKLCGVVSYTKELACYAFFQYVNSGRFKVKERVNPTTKMYIKIFKENVND